MKLFTFSTDSLPKYSGEGVDWENGKITYRLSVDDGEYHAPSTVATGDLAFQYAGLPGWTLDYQD